IWHGESGTTAGGVKVKSNSIWMEIRTGQRSAAPAPRIISVEPGILNIRKANTAYFRVRSRVCRKSSSQTAYIRANSDSACIAGMSWTRYGFIRIYASPSKRLAGDRLWRANDGIYRYKMILPRRLYGIRQNRTQIFRCYRI